MTAKQRWDVIEHVMFQEGTVAIAQTKTAGRPGVDVKLIPDALPAPSGTLTAPAISPPLPAPSGTLSAPTPQTQSQSGIRDLRHFGTPPRVREGEGFSEANIHMTPLAPEMDTHTDTPPENKVPEGAESRPRRATPDDDIPF